MQDGTTTAASAVADGNANTLALVPGPEAPLAVLGARLTGYTTGSEVMSEAVAADGPYANFTDFSTRALRKAVRAMREYTIAGHGVRVVVPEDYAVRLDEVRRLRLRAAESCLEHADVQSDALSADDARALLCQHPLRSRVLPEELAALLDELPDPGLFKRLILLDEENPEDRWTRQEYNASWFVSAMATEPNGDVLLFKCERNEFLRVNLFHEWTHKLEKSSPKVFASFVDAIELGWRKYVPRLYALRSYGEHWAVVGEELLHVDAARFLEVADKAPVRTTLWMLALSDALAASNNGQFAGALSARIEYVRVSVAPKARQALASFLDEDGSANQSRACRITLFLNERLGN